MINSLGKKATTDVAARLRRPWRFLVFFSALSVGCGSSGRERGADGPPGVSTIPLGPVIDFSFDSLDDRPVNAQSAYGKPTIVAFVTTSSLPSQAQVDFLVAMAKNDASRVNFAVVALEPREGRELVEVYKKSLSIPFPVALADVQTLASLGPFGDVSSVPVTVLLDRDGRVVWRVDGRVATSHEIRAALHGL